MLSQTTEAAGPSLRTVLREFVAGIVGTLPRLLAGLVFLAVAYLVIRVVVRISRGILERVYPPSEQLIADLLVTIIALFLWFGAALALLKIVGLGDVAASLGTAAGFIGLGVAYALKEMIADTVAGVYLLRDPDFNEGDFVTTASTTGTITGIDLRKTRLRTVDDDLVVLANRDVEEQWTKEAPDAGDSDAIASAT